MIKNIKNMIQAELLSHRAVHNLFYLSWPDKLLIDTSNRAQNPGPKTGAQSAFRKVPSPRPPPGPKTRCRPGQVEKIVHGPVW